jgi:hypothetical protein
MHTDAIKRLKELEKENSRLKKIVADQAVDISILKKEVSRKNFSRARPEDEPPSHMRDESSRSPSVGRVR